MGCDQTWYSSVSSWAVTKLGITVHHCGLGCKAKEMGCYFQGQGHSEGLLNQNMTISAVSFKLMTLLQPN